MLSIAELSEANLLAALTNEHYIRRTPDEKIGRLLAYVEGFGTPATLLTEDNYTDRDFISDYTHYYATCGKSYSKNCRRLHFFALPKDRIRAAFDSLLTQGVTASQEALKLLNSSYVGFLVVKPLPVTVLGRTVFKAPSNANPEETLGCLRNHKVGLWGIPLSVTGLAWQEQDTVISACATSAIWSALHKTAHEFGYYIPTPYEITTKATTLGHEGRPIPSEGLNVAEMSHAIRSIGLDVEMLDTIKYAPRRRPTAMLPLLSYCYSYLRGGIPVVLVVKINDTLHAVTLCGYELGNSQPDHNELEFVPAEEDAMVGEIPWFRSKGARIVAFYAHDDQLQPYARFEVKQALGGLVTFGTQWARPVVPEAVVVPLYHKIRISILPLLRHVRELNEWLAAADLFAGSDEPVEFEMFHATNQSYKADLAKEQVVLARADVLLKQLPRFLWRVQCQQGSRVIFELVGDATDMQHSFQFVDFNFRSIEFAEATKRAFVSAKLDITKLIKPMGRLLLAALQRSGA